MNLKKKSDKKMALRYIAERISRDKADLHNLKREASEMFSIPILKNREIIAYCKQQDRSGTNHAIIARSELLLKKRAVRTLSGVAPVAVLTMPYACPGKCAFCPSEKNIPKSYLSNEPAVMRAIRCGFDPFLQVSSRLKALEDNGHSPEKIELIVIGGTWSFLPKKYKFWFIKECFRAANNYRFESKAIEVESKKSSSKIKISDQRKGLMREQKRNETAKYKIIGLTLETRPDHITLRELEEMRELGCTRVELGVQAIDDRILKLNKRGHDTAEITRATKLLKDCGFKITYHIMPALPGSDPEKDYTMFKQLFTDENFQPDQIKFYPTVVTKGSLLYGWWKKEKYKPYEEKVLEKLIIDCKAVVPEYVRIIRLIRDIPEESIIAGNKITNLRQILKAKGALCRCIRCREVKDRGTVADGLELLTRKYKASGGQEFFISLEDKEGKILYGFCRLRIPGQTRFACFPELSGAGLIRELHVYGALARIGKSGEVQHTGLGKKLMAEAERIVKEMGLARIAVISGVGSRQYYRMLGYRRRGTYMLKRITD